MLRPDPAARGRLAEIIKNLADRISEARINGWLGEVEGLQISFNSARAKLAAIDRAARNNAGPADLGMPDAKTLKSLKLTPSQRDQFRQIYMSAVGKSFSTGGDREAQKAVFKAAAAQFDTVLDPAQKAIFEAAVGLAKPTVGGPKMGTVYVLQGGQPVAVQVQIGATDGTLTEVSGPLAADAPVITGGGPKAPPRGQVVIGGGPR